MHSTRSLVECMQIYDVPRLDPIRVYFEDYAPGHGRMTISCYDMAWTGYWGGMGDRSIKAFVSDCDAWYLSQNLGSGSGLNRAKKYEEYLIRVIKAVKEALTLEVKVEG
jgi:hypothetical protein